MNLKQLEKIFQNLDEDLTFKEVVLKASLFWELGKQLDIVLEEDYWIQLAKNWDLNIWVEDDGVHRCLYPVKIVHRYSVTETLEPHSF